MKKTKIVASLGPKSSDIEIIENMVLAGADVFRINLSHATYKQCDDLIAKVRKVEKKLNKIIGIMLDTNGPCIRIDKLKEEEVYLQKDKEVKFYNYHVVCNNTQLSTNCTNLVDFVNLDDYLYLAGGKISLQVIKINEDNFVCKVIEKGTIKSNQTLTIKNAIYNLPFINQVDKENILFAIKNKVDFLALSNVRDEQDILSVVDMLIENGDEHISLISKIENEKAIYNLEEILKVSDGVMVARGDLSLNSNVYKLPYYQKKILSLANEYQKIGLVATDLMNRMVLEKTPSKAEISDIYNSVFDKCDGLILCDETAIGLYPVESVNYMSNIIETAENDFSYKDNLEKTFQEGEIDITSTISYSVVNSGLLLNAKCILANTMSGYTARKISYFRPKCLVLGLSPNINTVRSLTLNYGVIPVHVKKYHDTDQIVSECIKKYKEIFEYENEDIIIITGGLPLNNNNTDFMKIEKIVD